MKKIPILPSLLTLGNAVCGFLAIAYTADGLLFSTSPPNDPAVFLDRLVIASWLILLGMVFDALDGKVARMTRRTSDFGGQLDSLCDAITFGIAPAFLTKVLIDYQAALEQVRPHPKLYFGAAAIFAMCAILRLALFNVENEHGEDAHMKFRGLPTPAAAGVIASTIIFLLGIPDSWFAGWITGENREGLSRVLVIILPFYLPILGLLMVSRLPFVHFLNYMVRGRKPFHVLVQIVLVLTIAFLEPILALVLIFYIYTLSGPFMALHRMLFPKRSAGDGEPLPDQS